MLVLDRHEPSCSASHMLSTASFQAREPVRWSARSAFFAGLILLPVCTLSCAGRADLVAGPGHKALECPTDADHRLLITVSNQGRRATIATTTVLQYEDRPEVHVPTRPILPTHSQTLTVRLPDECLWSACSFEISVDYKDEVDEVDEANNLFRGQCLRAGRKQATRP